MPLWFGVDHKQIVFGILGVSSGVAIYSTYKWLSEKRKYQTRNVYESKKLLNEYLVFHYGSSKEVLRYDFGLNDSLEFPKRCAELCIKHFKDKVSGYFTVRKTRTQQTHLYLWELTIYICFSCILMLEII